MGTFNSLIRWFLLIVVSVFVVTSLCFMYHIVVSDVDTRIADENRTTKRTHVSRLSDDDEKDPQLHQNAHIDYQVHSWDDLNEWEQGINKGVTWFKVDLFYTPSHICAQNSNSNNNDNKKNNSEKNQKKRACFLMTHDPPDINNPHKYNTTNDLIQMLRSWKKKHRYNNQQNHQKKKKITIALCFKYFLLLDATRYLESRYFVDHHRHPSHRSTSTYSSSSLSNNNNNNNNKKKKKKKLAVEWYLLNRNPCHVPPRFNTLNHDYNQQQQQQQQQQQTNHNDDDEYDDDEYDDEYDDTMVDLFPHMMKMKKKRQQQERSQNNNSNNSSHDRATAEAAAAAAAAVIHLYDNQYHSPYLLRAHSSSSQQQQQQQQHKYGDDSDDEDATTAMDHQFISLIDELYRELNAINDDNDMDHNLNNNNRNSNNTNNNNNNNNNNKNKKDMLEQEWEYEFVLDESGTHGNGRDCLKKKWMRWSSTFISTRDPMIAFVSNQPYHHRFKILNEPVMDRTESVMTNEDDKSSGGGTKAETEEDESSSEDDDNCKYLRRAQALRYGKFLHGEYPVLLWEPSHQAVIQQCIQLYLTGHDNDPSSRNQRQGMSNIDKGSRAQSSSAVVLNDSGLRFSINIDPIMFRIFMSYYYPVAIKNQKDNDSNSLPSLLPSDGNNSGSNHHHHRTISVIDNPEYHNQLNHHVPNTHMMVNEPSIQHHIWMTSHDDNDDNNDGQRQRKSPSANSDGEKTSSTRRHTLLFSCVVDTRPQQPSAAGQSAQLINKCHYQIISYRSNDSGEDKGIVIHQTPLQPLSLPSSSTNHPTTTTTTTTLVVKRFISMRHQQQPSTSSSVQPNNHQMYQLYAMIESINGQYFVCELRYNIHTFTVHYHSHYLIQLLNNEERDKMEGRGRLLWDFYLLPRMESSSQQDILLLSSLQNNNQKNMNDDDDDSGGGDDTCEIRIQLYQLRQDASQVGLKQVGQHTEIHWKLMSESFSIQSMSMALSDRAIMISSNNQYDGYLIFSVGVNRHGFKQSLVHGLSFHLSIHQSSLSYQLTSDAQDNLIHLSQRVPLSIGRHVSLSSFTTTSTTMTTNMWLTMVWDAGFCWNSVVHNLQATRLCELNPLDVFQSTSTTMRDAGKARPDNILAYSLIQLSDLIALQKKHQKVNDHTKRRHVLLSPCDSGTMIHGTFDRGTNPRVQSYYDSTKNVVRFLTSHMGTKGKRTFQYHSPLRKAAATDPGSPPTDPNLLTSHDVCGAAIAHNGIVIDYWTVLLPY